MKGCGPPVSFQAALAVSGSTQVVRQSPAPLLRIRARPRAGETRNAAICGHFVNLAPSCGPFGRRMPQAFTESEHRQSGEGEVGVGLTTSTSVVSVGEKRLGGGAPSFRARGMG